VNFGVRKAISIKKEVIIPFNFVLDQLERLQPVVKPMFGCHAIYVSDKIVLILRNKKTAKKDNGVWVATTAEHHESLQKTFPSLRPIAVFGEQSAWRNLPSNADDFEESVVAICELIVRNDPRIGKSPKGKTVRKR
jgi:hypothetical protein